MNYKSLSMLPNPKFKCNTFSVFPDLYWSTNISLRKGNFFLKLPSTKDFYNYK